MIGIIIMSHGNFAKEMLNSVQHITDARDGMDSVCLFPDDDVETKRQELIEKIKLVDKGKGVVIFTEIFGGTPSNIAISLLEQNKVEVLAGVNIPMVVKLVQEREKSPIKSAIDASIEAGKKYITSASQF